MAEDRSLLHRAVGQITLARFLGKMVVDEARRQVATDVRPALAAPDGPVVDTALAADELPIDGYEALTALEVVGVLATLTCSELEAVRRFESAHRARRTVLGKVDQLLESSQPGDGGARDAM